MRRSEAKHESSDRSDADLIRRLREECERLGTSIQVLGEELLRAGVTWGPLPRPDGHLMLEAERREHDLERAEIAALPEAAVVEGEGHATE